MSNTRQECEQKSLKDYAGSIQEAASTLGLTDESQPKRDSLRDRLRYSMNRIQKQASKSEAMQELDYLFNKNPETARIFELMEILKHEI
jgi:hypothetical protein